MQKKGENARIFILAFINKNEKYSNKLLFLYKRKWQKNKLYVIYAKNEEQRM